MLIIGWFSCGVPSAVACKLAIEKYGKNNLRLIHIEIESQHSDNDRFIKSCEDWYGKTIERIASDTFNSQFDVISKRKFVNSPHGSSCTLELKKRVRYRIEKECKYDGQIFSFTNEKKERIRANNFTLNFPEASPIYPLIDANLSKKDCFHIFEATGISIPAMYKMGFPNNNCIGCVKGGMGYWNLIRKEFPDTFIKMAKLEREIGHSCIKGIFLDELEPNRGQNKPVYIESCSLHCQVG